MDKYIVILLIYVAAYAFAQIMKPYIAKS